jgi:hypothetical protein
MLMASTALPFGAAPVADEVIVGGDLAFSKSLSAATLHRIGRGVKFFMATDVEPNEWIPICEIKTLRISPNEYAA